MKQWHFGHRKKRRHKALQQANQASPNNILYMYALGSGHQENAWPPRPTRGLDDGEGVEHTEHAKPWRSVVLRAVTNLPEALLGCHAAARVSCGHWCVLIHMRK